ncbi:MAG: STAS domain-containing protein [Terrimicrobiaceae bacterium]|nr:STAS domain-containing protein [Terrimicrobiaceae bacterium]
MAAFQTSQESGVNVLRITGKLDPFGWRDLKDIITSLTSESADLLVDLSGLDFMASSGFRELFLAGRSLARNGRRLAVCGLQGEVKRVFELAKFETAYPIFDSTEAALAWFQSGESR